MGFSSGSASIPGTTVAVRGTCGRFSEWEQLFDKAEATNPCIKTLPSTCLVNDARLRPQINSTKLTHLKPISSKTHTNHGYSSTRYYRVSQSTYEDRFAQSQHISDCDFPFPTIQLWWGTTYSNNDGAKAIETLRYARHQDPAPGKRQSEWPRYIGHAGLSS